MHPKKYLFIFVCPENFRYDLLSFLSSDSLLLIVNNTKAFGLSETLFFTCDITSYEEETHDNPTGFAYHKAPKVYFQCLFFAFLFTFSNPIFHGPLLFNNYNEAAVTPYSGLEEKYHSCSTI